MRIIYFIIPCILILSCGKPPEPLTATPENAPLETPEEFSRLGLSLEGKYAGSQIFNFFFWPSNISDEARSDLATEVSRIGTLVEDVLPDFFKASSDQYKLDKEVEELKEKIKKKIKDLLEEYPCSKNEAGDSCVIGGPNPIYPKSCGSLEKKPWNSQTDMKICREKEDKIKSELNPLLEEKKKVDQNYGDLSNFLAKGSTDITNLLENNNPNPWEYINWIQTPTTGGAKIKFEKGVPHITMKIMFNNKKGANEYLHYSSDKGDIIDIEYFLENQIPNLSFTILEKRFIGPNEEEANTEPNTEPKTEKPTGVYYKVNLKQTEHYFGLEYLGKVKRFDAHGKDFGEGMMKLFFLPKEEEE